MPKRVPPISSTAFAKLKPDPDRTIELVDGAVPGLRLRITPAGTRTWSLNMRSRGVMRRFDVGTGLGLSEARQRAEDLRRRVRDGADPTAERRAARLVTVSAKQGIGTLESVIDHYYDKGAGSQLRTRVEQLKRIKSVFAEHLASPAVDIVSSELQRTIDAHEARVSAARATSYLKPVIQWALKRDMMRGSFDLEKPLAPEPNQRVLSETELKSLLPQLEGGYGLCSRFILLTGARRDEAQNATWAQVDRQAETWTIPASSRKDTRPVARRRGQRRQDHVVPLSRQALSVLDDARELEARRRQIAQDETEIADCDRIFLGTRGGELVNWDRWLKQLSSKAGVAGWSPHCLRRTTATLAGDLGAPPHIVSAILGHSNIGGQLVAGYNHSRYLDQHKVYLQRVANRCDQLESGDAEQEPSNILKISAGAAA